MFILLRRQNGERRSQNGGQTLADDDVSVCGLIEGKGRNAQNVSPLPPNANYLAARYHNCTIRLK